MEEKKPQPTPQQGKAKKNMAPLIIIIVLVLVIIPIVAGLLYYCKRFFERLLHVAEFCQKLNRYGLLLWNKEGPGYYPRPPCSFGFLKLVTSVSTVSKV